MKIYRIRIVSYCIVRHDDYADQTDRQTDGRWPDRCIAHFAKRGQGNNSNVSPLLG